MDMTDLLLTSNLIFAALSLFILYLVQPHLCLSTVIFNGFYEARFLSFPVYSTIVRILLICCHFLDTPLFLPPFPYFLAVDNHLNPFLSV